MALGTVQPVTLSITGTLKAAEKYFVGNAEQWQKVLSSLPAVTASTSTAAKALNIELLNEVKLSAADIALIQSTNAKDYTINITGGTLTLTETCALSDMTVENVSVKAGATVEMNKNLKVNTLNNAGTININAVSGIGNKVAEITTLNNFGEANVNAAAEIATVVNGSSVAKANNSAVELNVKANLTVTTAFTNNDAEKAENNATVTVDEAAVLKTTAGTNKGTIENNGQIIADGTFTNTGAKAVINNKATGILTNVNGAGKKVENRLGANINAEAGSTMVVADNTASTITYQDGANVSVTNTGDAKGKIAYVVASTYLVPTTAVEYNTIVVDGLEIKLNKKENTAAEDLLGTAGITNVVLKNGATVDFSLQDAAITLIEVEGSNNKIITAATGISTTTLKVLEKGYVLIPQNSKVTSTGNTAGVGLQNEGTINVGGTLVYISTGAVKGQLLGTGTITEK